MSDEGDLNETQARALKQKFKQQYQGSNNAGDVIITPKKLSWVNFGLNATDLSLLEQYDSTIKDLCNIYNVPVQLLNNTSASTYNNQKEAKKALYQNAVIPELIKVRDELNRWLTPLYGDKLYIDFDFTVIPELQEETEKVVQQMSQAWWLTPNEKRAATGYGIDEENPDLDKYYVPANLIPIAGEELLPIDENKEVDIDYLELMKAEVVGSKDMYTTIQEAKDRAAQLGGTGYHTHIFRGGTVYMPFENHEAYEAAITGKLDDPPAGIKKQLNHNKTYTQIFGEWLCETAQKDDRLIGITPAMREGSGLVEFSQQYPERYFDVGIAEQHAVTFAAGLATEDLKPVLAIYSTFLQRAYDQFIHDVCIQNLDVTFALDRSGLVGADGPTHHGAFDLAYLRCVPNVVVMTPSDARQCREMLSLAYDHCGPSVVRYPRGNAIDAGGAKRAPLVIGKSELVREGRTALAILVFGPILHTAIVVAEKLDATVVDMRFVKPLDVAMVRKLEESKSLLVTIEDGVVMGGAGSAVCEALGNVNSKVLRIGLPDKFVAHGDTNLLFQECCLDEQGILEQINDFMRKAD